MSPDLIGIVVALAAFCASVLGGVRIMLARQTAALESRFDRIDARFEKVDARFEKIDARFEKIDARFEKIDARFEHLEEKFDDRFVRLEEELSGVKVAIARLEGPLPRLQRL